VAITTLTSREFNQDVSRAKRAAKKGPVFVTDRGRPSHVLLTIDEYRKLNGKRKSILDLLAMPEVGDIDFEPPRLEGEFFRAADFS
jgi:prevent-host-death family protein